MADTQRPAAVPVPAGPSGYVIRPPQSAQPQPAPVQPSASPPAAASIAVPSAEPIAGAGAGAGLTQNGAAVGAAIMLVLAVVFFLLRGAIRSHLIDNRASLASAGAASWALFSFLFVLATTVVFGIAGQLWAVPAFIVPLSVLCLVTLLLFLYLFGAARRLGR